MKTPAQSLALSFLSLVLISISLCAQTPRSLTAREILNLNGPSVLKIEVHGKQDALAAQASGVVIAPGGIVATNAHVVQDACNLYIKESSGSLIAATALVQIDVDKDIAILQFDSDFPVAMLGDSRTVRVGDRVVAIGSPLGLEQTVSDGIVSGLRTTEHGRAIIQMTAPISPGSSGGGLFNDKGELIGLTTFTLQDSQNLNFAVPVADVLDLLKRRSEKAWPKASFCSELASSLDAMVIDQQLLGREISDPEVAEVLNRLNEGTAPAPFQNLVLAGGEMRSYLFPRIHIKVWFQNGRCQSVMYFPGFNGILPLGLSWALSQSQVRQVIGRPAQSYTLPGTDPTPEDEYHFGQDSYSVDYTQEGKLTGITAFRELQ